LKTDSVQVQLHQKPTGAARIVIDVGNANDRDSFIDAIKELARDL
jgi:hypothetical protein